MDIETLQKQNAELLLAVQAVNSYAFDLTAKLCAVDVVKEIHGHELIRREQVMELVTQWRMKWDARPVTNMGQRVQTWVERYHACNPCNYHEAIEFRDLCRDAEIADLRAALVATQEELDEWVFTNKIDELQRQLHDALGRAGTQDSKNSGCRMTGGICACRSGGSFGGCARERGDCSLAQPARPTANGASGQEGGAA